MKYNYHNGAIEMFYSIHFKPRALKDLKAIERKKEKHRKDIYNT